ncbi:MAG: hypothetical protein ACPHCI_05830 [Solirubrobacterales bacterium]
MSENDETSDDLGGSLADAIAAHLELKKEHGADPEELDREFDTALSPANRDEDDSVDLHPASEEPSPEGATEPSPPEAIEPEELQEPEEPEPVSELETEAAAEPEPAVEPEPSEAAPATEHAPGEITGTIEFEWDKEDEAAAAAPTAEPVDHDLLEDTPDFFEETPEHDKLWFDEAPPRKFDF